MSVSNCGWCGEPATGTVVLSQGGSRNPQKRSQRGEKTAPVCAEHAASFERRGMTVKVAA